MLKYLVILALSFFNANAALAGWADFPALYDVTGVALDDVLNVREGTGASYPVIETLAPNDRNIEIVQLSDDGKWGLIGYPGGSGWASMRYLARQPGQDGRGFPSSLGCGGTEPFWGLVFNGQSANYDMMGEDNQSFTKVWEDTAVGMAPISYAVKLQGNGGDITAVIHRNLCNDGMSEMTYGFDIDVIFSRPSGNSYYSGCCSLN